MNPTCVIHVINLTPKKQTRVFIVKNKQIIYDQLFYPKCEEYISIKKDVIIHITNRTLLPQTGLVSYV